MENYITIQELAFLVGCSAQTIGSYYKFKKENPNNELAKILPDFVRIGKRNTRYWKEEDAEVIKEFRKNLPQGRNGALGSVTQRYVKKNHEQSSNDEELRNIEHTVTLEDYRLAQKVVTAEIARDLSMINRDKEDEKSINIILEMIALFASETEALLFPGEESKLSDGKEVFDLKTSPRIIVIGDDEKRI